MTESTTNDGEDEPGFTFGDERYTSDELAEMDEDERDNLFAEKTAELDAAAEEAAKLSDDDIAAIDALAEAERRETVSVALTDETTVEVRTSLTAAIEEQLDSIAGERHEQVPEVAEVMAYLIEDERWGYVGEPAPEEAERAKQLWVMYAERNGFTGIMKMFNRVMEPVFDEMESAGVARRFRTDR